MTYPEALTFLHGMRRHGFKPGLDGIQRLSAAWGNPERNLRFIHVAGTNGKGSTCAFLESIQRAAGRRVGLYTSPHLVGFRERIQVDCMPISEADAARLVAEAMPELKRMSDTDHPTFFELVTWMALRWFESQRCDLVVWETGLGGRWDATNVVIPEASVITNIGWDHMRWLGNTLPAIAAEKAGIIKPGVPVLTATDDPSALEVIRETASRQAAPFTHVGDDHPEVARVRSWRLPLPGLHQVRNAALAVATTRALSSAWPVSEDRIRPAVESTQWPGRFDVRQRGHQTLVIDGAHNRPAFEALAAALRERYPGRRFGLVLGMLADKELASAVPGLVSEATRTLVVPVQSDRGCAPEELVRVLRESHPSARVEPSGGWESALRTLADESLVVVAGSLYLVGEVLGEISGASNSERALNDWSPRP